jgi:hypothetical protein
MATLGQLRQDFTHLAASLILKAEQMGYRVSYGETLRSDEQAQINALGVEGRLALASLISNRYPGLAAAITNNAGSGIKNSVHQLGLAVDLNLFKGGVYLASSEDHRPLGDWWKSQHPLARWGGDFQPRPDGNHYSFEYNGVK